MTGTRLQHAALLSLIAFAMHLVWEVVQCPILFVHGTYDGTWKGMTVAALGDVGITWLIYVGVAAVSRRWRWEKGVWRMRHWVTLLVTALMIGAAVEWRGLHSGAWQYNASMPIVPGIGIGVVPLVQMIVLTPVVIAMTARAFGGGRSCTRP
jgi:hypothetical protein